MSTNDPIEDLFRENQHGLDEKPRDLIWDRIEERLDERPSISKKKSNGWKYAVAACVVVGISLAGFILINQNFAAEYPENSTTVVLESVELNEEKATEILDQLEVESTAIVTTKSNAPAPEIMEEELKKTVLVSPKTPMEPAAEISVYDAPVMAAPTAPQMEMESVKPMAKQEKVPSYSTGNYTKKEQNKEIGNLDFEGRRLGNMAEKSVLYDEKLAPEALEIKIKKGLILYKIFARSENSITFINPTILYPSQIIFQKENDSIQVKYTGNEAKKETSESKEIHEFIQANKEQIIKNFDL